MTPECADLVAQILRENGFPRERRAQAPVWDALTRLPIDLVLLDVMLPGTSGMDLCRTLARKAAFRS